jgi:hypothetical protein
MASTDDGHHTQEVMVSLRKQRGGMYDVEHSWYDPESAQWFAGIYLATIDRPRSGSSLWLVYDRQQRPVIGDRAFPSLTVALDALLAHFGIDDDARMIVDQTMIENGRAAPRRRMPR